MTPNSATNDQTHRGWALFVLAAVYMSNCMDRSIVAVLGEAIKTDLELSNAQLGLLGGMAFALFYSLLGLPIARLAERFNRTAILTICVTLWSGMTMLCAMAPNFLYLALCRMGVGIGEAGCSPVAHSLVSDYYEARRRATAISIYSAGCSVGQILIAFAGGWVAQVYGWRVAFVLAGIPGLILALLIRFTLREPPRGALDSTASDSAKAVPTPSSLLEVASRLFRAPTIRHSIIGCVVVTVAAYGTHQFTAPFFIRAFSVSYAQAGIAFGVTVGIASAIGLLLGGFLADRVARYDARWYAGVPALGVLLSGPLYMLGFMQQGWIVSMLLLVIPGVLHFTYLGPTVSMLHNYVRANERATASAILLLLTSLIGLGLGPWIVGLIIDALIASSGSTPVGTRQGMVLSSAIYLWGAGHYAWAIRSFFKDLPALRETTSGNAANSAPE